MYCPEMLKGQGAVHRIGRAAVAVVDLLVRRREQLRHDKAFPEADEIREVLRGLDIEIEDHPDGVRWHLIDLHPTATKRFFNWLASQWARDTRMPERPNP